MTKVSQKFPVATIAAGPHVEHDARGDTERLSLVARTLKKDEVRRMPISPKGRWR